MSATNGLALHDELKRAAQRWPVAAGAKVDRYVRERIRDAAVVESRRVLATAYAEVAQQAMERFIELLYDADLNGRLFNVRKGGQILIPTPWSRTCHASYGLTDHGARVLRSIVTWRLAQLPTRHQLLWCDGRLWSLNISRFGNYDLAAAWLNQFPITAELWHEHNAALPRRGHQDR